MPGLGRDVVWQIAERECFRLHLQVDLRVDVRGVQGDMPEPRPDGIDVHAEAKQMGCRPPERQNLCVVNIKQML